MTNLGAKGFNPKKGSMPVLQWMPPKMLAVDPAYQRSIDNNSSRALISRIAKDWDWDLCQPLVVSQREDRQLYVVDGQHRLAAAVLRGDIEQLPCFICSLPDIAAEADRFVQFNRNRKALKPLDLWKAAVASGDREALVVQALVEAAGLKVAPTTNNVNGVNQLTNIGGLQRCYREQGVDQLAAVLDILATAFRNEVLQYAGTIFTGIAAIVADECKDSDAKLWQTGHRADLLVECLQSKKQAQWFNRVQRALADRGGTRKLVTNCVFREAWVVWQGKARPAIMPAPPRITQTIDIPRKPAAPAPAAPTPAPAPAAPTPAPPPSPPVPFEEQLRRVEAGEVGIADKITMKRDGDDRTLGGVVGEIIA